ncbi:MAG: hypothetical protein ACTH2U_11040 [Brevibacterium sp.]
MTIAIGVALGVLVFLVTYIVFGVVAKLMNQAMEDSPIGPKAVFYGICSIIAVLVGVPGAIGLGLLTALTIIGG